MSPDQLVASYRIRWSDNGEICIMVQGVHPKLVQEQLGHAQIATTMDRHSHVLPAVMEEVARKMDSILRTHKKQR